MIGRDAQNTEAEMTSPFRADVSKELDRLLQLECIEQDNSVVFLIMDQVQ